MSGAIPPFPQYVFMAWCLVKHRDDEDRDSLRKFGVLFHTGSAYRMRIFRWINKI
jgi:hypothetical protein